MTPQEILNEEASRLERIFTEIKAIQNQFSLNANHRIGVVLYSLRFQVIEKLREIAKDVK